MEIKKGKIRLKGHESFPIREGWLTKGMQAVRQNPKVFVNNLGADELGVGSNMAKSIRFWLKACGLTVEVKGQGSSLTDLGELIAKNDPYLEDMYSVWLIHMELMSNTEYTAVWNLFFNRCELEEFTIEEMTENMKYLIQMYWSEDFSEKSLESDCSVLLSMYSREIEDYDPEDKKLSPLTRLGIIRKTQNGYKRGIPSAPISKEVMWYSILRKLSGDSHISIDTLVNSDNGPGKCFCIGRTEVCNYLDMLKAENLIEINYTAGLDVIYMRGTKTYALEAATKYYEGKGHNS